MKNRFSFDSAEQLIQLLKITYNVLNGHSDKLLLLYQQLGNVFKDEAYFELMGSIQSTYNAGLASKQQLALIIASLARYKEQLYQLYIEDLITQIGFETISYEPTARFGTAGEKLEQMNLELAFQNEIKSKIRDKRILKIIKESYASIGSKCIITSDAYTGTAFYSPASGSIKFNLESDLSNPCGVLSTYFHEIGHMIDCQTNSNQWLSDHKAFQDALNYDCKNYFSSIEQRYGCNLDTAYYYVSKELMTDNDLYADVSDILCGLTQCKCQNLWGHSLSYWKHDPKRVYREAFANMYSVAFGSPERVNIMNKYFPTAYACFIDILEEFQ